jgi:hypothetical protein
MSNIPNAVTQPKLTSAALRTADLDMRSTLQQLQDFHGKAVGIQNANGGFTSVREKNGVVEINPTGKAWVPVGLSSGQTETITKTIVEQVSSSVSTSTGMTFYFGAGSPTGAIGHNGDVYVNTTDATEWLNVSGTWVMKCDLQAIIVAAVEAILTGMGLDWTTVPGHCRFTSNPHLALGVDMENETTSTTVP